MFETVISIEKGDILCDRTRTFIFRVDAAGHAFLHKSDGTQEWGYQVWLDNMTMQESFFTYAFGNSGFMIERVQNRVLMVAIAYVIKGGDEIRIKRLSAASKEDKVPFEEAILLYYEDSNFIDKDEDEKEVSISQKGKWPENTTT